MGEVTRVAYDGEKYALSPLQMGMFVHYLRDGHSGIDIQQIVMDLHHPVDLDRFRAAWQATVQCHSVLRTRFCWEGLTEPVQEVLPAATLPFVVQDWQKLSPVEVDAAMTSFVAEDRRRGFVMDQAPLMRLAVFVLGPAEFRVVWTSHHILLDGRCYTLILNEVFGRYEAALRGDTFVAQPYPAFREYVAFTRGLDLEDARKFWEEKLKGFTATTPMLEDSASVPLGGGVSEQREIVIPEATAAGLNELAKREGLSVNNIIQGVWALLLSRYSGEPDVVFGATKTARRSSVPGADSTMGLLLNTLPVRVCVEDGLPVVEWLRKVRAEWISLRPVEHTPLVSIKEASPLPPDAPLFDSIVMFEYRRFFDDLRAQGGDWQRRDFRLLEFTGATLTLFAYGGRPFILEIGYPAGRFSEQTVSRMLGHLQTLLEAIAANPQVKVAELPLLTEAERRQILVEWNSWNVDYPRDIGLHDLVEQQAKRTPDAEALKYQNESLTYAQMNARANQLAHYLRKQGVGRDVLVGVCAERSLEMVLALLAVLKAGGCFLPLDPEYPSDRLRVIIEDARPPVVLTQAHILPRVPETEGTVRFCLDSEWPALAGEPVANPEAGAKGKDLCYAIYTSGSTGKPKGTLNVHEGIVNRVLWGQDQYHMGPGDRVLQKTPFSFDVSVWEFFWPLLTGAALVIAVPGGHRDPVYLRDIVQRERITMMHFVPSMLQMFLEIPGIEECRTLKKVFCSGEALPFEVQQRFFQRLNAELHDLYGPAEAAVEVTYWACQRNPGSRIVPIGRPIANTQILILDKNQQPVPVGVPGELLIGGVNLARGYLNRPELTAEKFIANPFPELPTDRLYRTGDLARFLPDGNVEYLGRMDFQLKIRGQRVELGEIETVLQQYDGVKQAIVLAREDTPGDVRLVAYLVLLPGAAAPAPADLRAFLKKSLPEYMVPADYVMLDKVPINPNGKIDRKALPVPQYAEGGGEADYLAPRTPTEERLAKIWCEVLGAKRVGVEDNFFDLGGHSLLAVRLFGRISQEFQQTLSLNTLFHSPTVAQLAALLEAPPQELSAHAMVPINTTGSRLPVYWVPGGRGQAALGIRDISLLLGEDQPTYALESQSPPGEAEPMGVVERATAYVKLIREVQPHGPYCLAGFCLGGYVAYEIAQQLQAAGETVAFIAIVNSYFPCIPSKAEKMQYWIQRRIWQFSNLKLRQVGALIRRKFQPHTHQPADPSIAINDRVMRRYRPVPYSGLITLFISTESDFKGVSAKLDPRRKWAELAKAETIFVPGDHDSILMRPDVEPFSIKLREALRQAQDQATGKAAVSSS